jgi:hypothetical protein
VLEANAPFTAARGRNRGFALAKARVPMLRWVQFVDGDCVLATGWIDAALGQFMTQPDLGSVAGRLREDDPRRDVYHRLADMEWHVLPGYVDSTGGIAMFRAEAFESAGGFDAQLAAGEELELAIRLRAHGYRILRIDAEMARHDIEMSTFGEWWLRSVRGGRACADGVYKQGRAVGAAQLRRLASILVWGAALPAAAVVLAPLTHRASFVLLGAYAVLWYRVRKHRIAIYGDEAFDASLYASAAVLTKFASVWGVAQVALRLLRGSLRSPG